MKKKFLSSEKCNKLENLNRNIKRDYLAFYLVLDLLNGYKQYSYLNEEIVQELFLDRIELLEKHSKELNKVFNSLYITNDEE